MESIKNQVRRVGGDDPASTEFQVEIHDSRARRESLIKEGLELTNSIECRPHTNEKPFALNIASDEELQRGLVQ